jgi:hypothetical protein
MSQKKALGANLSESKNPSITPTRISKAALKIISEE